MRIPFIALAVVLVSACLAVAIPPQPPAAKGTVGFGATIGGDNTLTCGGGWTVAADWTLTSIKVYVTENVAGVAGNFILEAGGTIDAAAKTWEAITPPLAPTTYRVWVIQTIEKGNEKQYLTDVVLQRIILPGVVVPAPPAFPAAGVYLGWVNGAPGRNGPQMSGTGPTNPGVGWVLDGDDPAFMFCLPALGGVVDRSPAVVAMGPGTANTWSATGNYALPPGSQYHVVVLANVKNGGNKQLVGSEIKFNK